MFLFDEILAPKKPLKVLIACECSGVVKRAFLELGHDVYSCDLKPSDDPERHLIGDVRDYIYDYWDMCIAHPTCTRLCNSGVLRLYNDGKKKNGIDTVKWEEMEEGAAFFKLFTNLKHIPKVGIENPIPHIYAMERIGRKYDQIIQPWQFGDNASKATCLWLKGLPRLVPTQHASGARLINRKRKWSNQTDSGQNKLPPSEERAALRAVTYRGVAMAMAMQWGGRVS